MVERWHRAARLGAAVGLAAALAGCGGPRTAAPPSSGPPGPTPTSTAPGPSSPGIPTAVPTTAPAPTAASPSATEGSLPGTPPAAVLGGLKGDRTAEGTLGSYTWAGGGSDAPWLVAKRSGSANVGSPVRVTFGGLAPASWSAAWAKVVGGVPATPVSGTAGLEVVALNAPPAAGDWTLRVTASFGPGANATYYWRLALVP